MQDIILIIIKLFDLENKSVKSYEVRVENVNTINEIYKYFRL